MTKTPSPPPSPPPSLDELKAIAETTLKTLPDELAHHITGVVIPVDGGILVNAKKTFKGTVMPSFYKTSGFTRPGDGYTGKAPTGPIEPILSAQDVEDVVAFLMTLQD